MLGERTASEERGWPRPIHGEARAICRLCALSRAIAGAMLGVDAPAIETAGRGTAEAAHARHVAMYLAHVAFQLTLSEVAAGFGRDRTSVAHGVRRIEDRRDDAGFEALLSRMESVAQSVRELAGPICERSATDGR